MNKEGRVVNKIDWKLIAKVWVNFLKYRVMPTTHTTIVSQDRLILFYAIVKRLTIDDEKVIERKIIECATKNQKSATLLFLSLIIDICKVSRVKFVSSDKRIKNKGALPAKTIERIASEPIIVATPEHLAVIKSG